MQSYDTLFSLSPLPIWVYDVENFKILDVNQAAINHYGYSAEGFLSRTLKELFPDEEFLRAISAYAQNKVEDENFYFGTFTHFTKSREEVRMDINGHSLVYKGRKSVLLIAQDITEKELQLRECKESEKKLKAAASIANLGYWSMDIETKVLTCSEEVYNIWDKENASLKLSYDNFLASIHPDDQEPFKLELKAAVAEGRGFNIVHRILLDDGKVKWIHEVGRIVKDVHSNPILFEGVVQDISEQKKVQDKFRKNEKRYKALIENGFDAIVILGADGAPNYVSPSITRVLGYTEEEALNLNLFDVVHPEEQEMLAKRLEKAMQSPGIPLKGITSRTKHKDGTWRWLEATVTNMLHDPDINGIVDNFRDVTDWKLEEQRLKLLESVIIHTNDAVVITEAEPFDEPGHRILFANEAFTKMTGYSVEEVIGKTPRILQGPKSNLGELARLKQALINWEPCEISTINYKKSGEEFWVNFTVSPVADENGWYTHWIAIERDITKQKNREIEKELLTQISLIFNSNKSIYACLDQLCERLSGFGEFDFVEVWLKDISQSYLHKFSSYASTKEGEKFNSLVDNTRVFKKGEGLPGSIWESQKAILWNCSDTNYMFTRMKSAKDAGIVSAFGLPLIQAEEFIGVLVLGTVKNSRRLDIYSDFFLELEEFIGTEIKRKTLENELSQIFDFAPDIIGVMGMDGYFKKLNPRASILLGFSNEVLLNSSFLDFLHPEDVGSMNEILEKLKEGISVSDFEIRIITNTGIIKWFNWAAELSPNEGMIFTIIKDITEKKEIAQLLDDATSMARIGSWEIDLTQMSVFWSPITFEIHGVSAGITPKLDEAISFFRSDFRPMVRELVDKCVETGEHFDFEAILITAQNEEKWVRSIGKAETVKGVCVRIFGSFQDIHARKILEIQMNEILESISDSFYALDKNWNFTFFNKEAENIFNRKSKDLLGKNIWEEFPNLQGSNIQKIYHQVAESGKAETFDHYYSGGESWFEVNVYPSQSGISAYLKNITERKKTAEQILRSYEEKNKILESIGDAFFAVDNNWVVTYWNKEAEINLNRDRKSILGKVLWDEYADSIDTQFYRQYNKAMETGKVVSFEEHFIPLHKWFEVTAYPSPDGLSVYFKDISLRKETDIRILQANERFEKVTEATNDAIWDWNIEDNSLYLGGGFKTKFGSHADDYISVDSWHQYIHKDDFDRVVNSLYQAIADQTVSNWTSEYRYRKSNGEFAFIIDKGVVIRNDMGNAIRMLGAMTDITYHKEHELELLKLNESLEKYAHDLETTNEQLEQFAFIASHDLQEPLRMISSFMNQLERKYHDQLDEKARQYIYFATDGAKRMKQIILDLLEYSRAGKLDETTELINLTDLLDEFTVLRQKVIGEKSVKISAIGLPKVVAYKAPLTQTIHCLLDNAIKYSKEDIVPEIVFTVVKREDDWLFTIKDNGIGIDSEFFEKIFIVFQRLHNRDQYQGTGIGLSIAKKHVESWGGKIWLESETGKGSTFYFTLKV